MATLEIHIQLPDNLMTRAQALRLGEVLIKAISRGAAEPTEHGSDELPILGTSRWVHGQFSDGFVHHPLT